MSKSEQALLNEVPMRGTGIMSAIDFDMVMERLPDPKGDCVKVTMSGKFLPIKYYGATGNAMATHRLAAPACKLKSETNLARERTPFRFQRRVELSCPARCSTEALGSKLLKGRIRPCI